MDMASIASIFTSLNTAREALAAAVDVRDFNIAAVELARLNDALLKAQNALLGQNAALFKMQGENFEMAKELAKLKESVAERDRYTLVEVHQGSFAYRVNLVPQAAGAVDPCGAESVHYLCQPCLDKPDSRKVVLQPKWSGQTPVLHCSVCGANIRSGDARPCAATHSRYLSHGI